MARLYEKIELKWRVDLILALYPNIPADIKAMGYRQDYRVREAAAKRLESLPGLTATYFKYHASKTTDSEVRSRYEKIHEKLEQKWRAERSWLFGEYHIAKLRAEGDRKTKELFANMVANLSKLSAEDLKLVAIQGGCPICDKVTLGSRGVPVKIVIKGQPVFLCCKDCIKMAQADPEKTLAQLNDKNWRATRSWWLKEFIKAHMRNPKQLPNTSDIKK